MAERLILYTSQTEGITLGIQGETWMECLLTLSEEFGDGLMPLYERTKEELSNLSAAVAETFEEEMEDIAKELGEQVTRESAEGEPEDDPLDVFRPNREETEGEDQQEDDQESDGGESAVEGTGGDAPTCELCGADTTKDYASLTKQMHGEVRCPDCTP